MGRRISRRRRVVASCVGSGAGAPRAVMVTCAARALVEKTRHTHGEGGDQSASGETSARGRRGGDATRTRRPEHGRASERIIDARRGAAATGGAATRRQRAPHLQDGDAASVAVLLGVIKGGVATLWEGASRSRTTTTTTTTRPTRRTSAERARAKTKAKRDETTIFLPFAMTQPGDGDAAGGGRRIEGRSPRRRAGATTLRPDGRGGSDDVILSSTRPQTTKIMMSSHMSLLRRRPPLATRAPRIAQKPAVIALLRAGGGGSEGLNPSSTPVGRSLQPGGWPATPFLAR